MPSYYLSEDLARFPDMGKTQPKLWGLYLKWYGATMEKGALDERTKKLIAFAVAFSIQEPYCIDSYASACADAGISPEEMAGRSTSPRPSAEAGRSRTGSRPATR